MTRAKRQVDTFYFGDVWIGLTKGADMRWGWSMGEDTVSEYKSTGKIYSRPFRVTWREAQDNCREWYTDLVSIKNARQQDSVSNIIYDINTWIGLFSDAWKWSDGSTTFFRNWGSGRPLSLFNISNCVVMQMNYEGTWDDSLCDLRLPFMCYKATTLKIRQVVKVKVSSDEMTDLNDPSVKANLLKKIKEILERYGMVNITIRWKDNDGTVFRLESDDLK
ncbi:brevican core protein-like [Trichomycterus rosablanca]|uniref:brevican core protein-like n=1 Tax=Trichomycterus rosablanca TaxID=2290929 RepID=UPI002F3603B7